MNKIFLILLLAFFFSEKGISQIDFKNASFDQMKSTAAADGNSFLVYVNSSWCISCQLMEETTFRNSSAKEIINEKYTPYRIDFDSESGKIWATEYDIAKLPAFLFFNETGGLIQKIEAPITPSAFKGLLKNPQYFNSDPKDAKEITLFSEINNGATAEQVTGEFLYHLDKQINELETLYIKHGISKKSHVKEAINLVTKSHEEGNSPAPHTVSNEYPPSEILQNTEELYSLIQELKDWEFRLRNSEFDLEQALVSSVDLPTESTKESLTLRIQMGYFKNLAYAERMAKDLKDSYQFPVEVRKEEKKEGVFHRVLLGSFSSQNEAKIVFKKMRKAGRKALVKEF